MSAATAAIDSPERNGETLNVGLAAAAVVWTGTMGAYNSSKYLVPASDASALQVVGRVEEDADNTSGANGDVTANVKRGTFEWNNSASDAVDANDRGKFCYVEDDNTVRETNGTYAIAAGIVISVTSAKVWVCTLYNAEIANLSLDGSKFKKLTEDQTAVGAIGLYAIAIAGGAAANEDITVAEACRVLDVWAVHRGGAGETSDTIRLYNGANPITDAMSWAGADQTVVRAATIDDAYYGLAAAGTLRATTTDNDSGSDVGAGVVYVLVMKV